MKNLLTRYLPPSLLCAVVALFVGGLIGPATVEDWLADRRMPLLARGERDPRVLVVAVDGPSLEEFGPWPWSRGVHARLVDEVRKGGGTAIFFDFLFEEAGVDAEGDQQLATSLKDFGHGYVAGAAAFGSGDASQWDPPKVYPPVAEAATIVLINRRLDPDGVLRWAVLGVPVQGGRTLPTAALALFAGLQGVPVDAIQYRPAESRVVVGTTQIPTSGLDVVKRPNELPILFRKAPAPISYVEALGGKVHFRDKIVLVGDASSNEQDTFPTPGGVLKGIEVHAAVLDTLLQGRFLQVVPWTVNLAITFAVCLAVTFLALRIQRPSRALGAAGAVILVQALLNVALYASGLWLDLVSPCLGGFLALGVAWGIRNRETRKLFGQFVAGQKVEAMLVSDRAAALGTREQVVTIFFTDIRGYTTLSETRSPVEVMDILNQYHSRVTQIYSRRGGIVMTYQGDAQIVVFGYREAGRDVPSPEAVVAAVQAGLEMQTAVAELRSRWGLQENERFEVGVGICTGRASIGNVGSAGHMQFTVLGDIVRFASDVQGFSATLDAPVILDGDSRAAAGDRIEVDELEPVSVKGRAEPVVLYRARALRSGARAEFAPSANP